MAQITYADKTAINVNPDVAATNKISDADMNEIKTVVNTNDTNVGDLSNLTTPVASSIVGAINSIVESGSNANGDYIKYADGTMICWGAKQTGTITFAETFISTPKMIVSVNNAQNNFMHVAQGSASSGSAGALVATYQSIGSTNAWAIDNSVYINYIAIGKWK